MYKRVLLKVNGLLLLFIAPLTLSPMWYAYAHNEAITPWFITFSAFVCCGLIGVILGRKSDVQKELNIKEGVASTTIFWLVTSIIASLAFRLSVPQITIFQAWFESMSGLTTTGSSIFGGHLDANGNQTGVMIEALSHSVLLWRSMLQWIGGIGIIVISIALMPLIVGRSGFQLYRAELPGLTADRLTPRLTKSAKILLGMYVGLTVLIGLLLYCCGIDSFDAACHAMTTISTGGFSTFDNSAEGLNSTAAEWVIIAGMYVAALNFTLLIQLLIGRTGPLFRNAEAKVFTYFILISWAIVVSSLSWHSDIYQNNPHDLARDSLFQVVSIISSTGFGSGYDSCTASWDAWPQSAIMILIICMIFGGCAGSTAGGIKIIRLVVLAKCIRGELRKYMEPKRVTPIHLDKKEIPAHVISQVHVFLTLFACSLLLGTVLFCLLGHTMSSSFSATLTALSNIGPGLGEIGASKNFGHFDSPSLVLSTMLMLLGRLELITVIVTFKPSNWRT